METPVNTYDKVVFSLILLFMVSFSSCKNDKVTSEQITKITVVKEKFPVAACCKGFPSRAKALAIKK